MVRRAKDPSRSLDVSKTPNAVGEFVQVHDENALLWRPRGMRLLQGARRSRPDPAPRADRDLPSRFRAEPGPGGIDEVWASAELDIWTDCGFLVHHSTDGGRTWLNPGFTPETENSFHVRGSSADDVWVISHFEFPRHTTNGGATWEQVALPQERDLGQFGGDLWSAGRGWAWLADGGIWVHPDRPLWLREVKPMGVFALWGTAANDIFGR